MLNRLALVFVAFVLVLTTAHTASAAHIEQVDPPEQEILVHSASTCRQFYNGHSTAKVCILVNEHDILGYNEGLLRYPPDTGNAGTNVIDRIYIDFISLRVDDGYRWRTDFDQWFKICSDCSGHKSTAWADYITDCGTLHAYEARVRYRVRWLDSGRIYPSVGTELLVSPTWWSSGC